MKKIISIVLVLALALTATFALVACDSEEYVVAMITDSGDITDQSFNQSTWEAVVDWSKENNKTYAYYKPADDTNDARVTSIKQAIQAGAKVVVTPGYLFETAIYEVQGDYPEVNFILLDGEPHTADDTVYKTTDNTTCILFQEEIAGYVAGYAAVMDGLTNLGFMGGMAVPAVQRYGLGFVEGANAAATEKEIEINIWYGYGNTFGTSDNVKTTVEGWVTDGCQSVFACGGGIWYSVADGIIAADKGASIIGVDVNQQPIINGIDSYKELKVLTSSYKDLYFATQTALGIWSEGKFDTIGGKTSTYGISANDATNYVGMPVNDEAWNFTTYEVSDYETVLADIRDGSIVVSKDTSIDSEAGIAAANDSIVLKAYTSVAAE